MTKRVQEIGWQTIRITLIVVAAVLALAVILMMAIIAFTSSAITETSKFLSEKA